MERDDFLSQVTQLLVEKTLEGKVRWSVAPALVRSEEVGKIRAEFRMATPNSGPLAGEWDRFIVYQQGQQLGQIFNGLKYPSLKGLKEQRFVPLVERLFDFLVVQPRDQSLRESLDALISL